MKKNLDVSSEECVNWVDFTKDKKQCRTLINTVANCQVT
jgi:hypothetical protein